MKCKLQNREYNYMIKLTELQNIHQCLLIIEDVRKQLDDAKAIQYVDKALVLSRQWLNDKTDVAEELYNLLDNEECSFTLYQESENDERMIDVWNCIIEATAYICRKVYEDKGSVYFPEPIELVDEDTYSLLLAHYEKCKR